MTPNIVKETANGFVCTTLQEELFYNREVECIGTIDRESVDSLIQQLLYLQRQNPKKPITMYINSWGGEVASGLALYDIMQGLSCPIRTICVGTAASMASLLFASGNKRDMLPHSRVMIHDPLIADMPGGSALKVEDVSNRLMNTRKTIAEILSKHTGKSLDEIYEKTSKDTYFNAEEAIEFGLADKIVESI